MKAILYLFFITGTCSYANAQTAVSGSRAAKTETTSEQSKTPTQTNEKAILVEKSKTAAVQEVPIVEAKTEDNVPQNNSAKKQPE